MSDGIFDGIGNAKPSGDGNWFRPGHYYSEIQAVKLATKFNGEKFLAIEQKIVKVLDNDEGRGHKVGEECTHLLKVANPSFLGNVKAFIAAALGCSPDEVGKAEADRVTSDEQPLAGIVVEVVARVKPKRNGDPFTLVTYKREVPEGEVNAAA